MNSEADENYWIGVRDALRMVDSFIEWAKRNPDRAKPIDQFVNEALIAAAKRCKSCLSHALGVSFAATSEEERERIASRPSVDFFEDTRTMVEGSPLADTLRDPDDLYHEQSPPTTPPPVPEFPEVPSESEGVADDLEFFERTPESREDSYTPPHESPVEDSTTEHELAAEFHESGLSDEPPEESHLDSLERTGSMSEEDIFSDDTPRDFESDFHLVEPEPLDTGSHDDSSAAETPSFEPGPEESSPGSEDKSASSVPDMDLASLSDALAELGRAIDDALYGEPEPTHDEPPSSGSSGPSELTGIESVFHELDEIESPVDEAHEDEPETPPPAKDAGEDTWGPDDGVLGASEFDEVSTDEATRPLLSSPPVFEPPEEPLVTPPPVFEPPEEPLVTPPPVSESIEEPSESSPFASTVSEPQREPLDEPVSTDSSIDEHKDAEPELGRSWGSSSERRETWSPYDEPSADTEDVSSDEDETTGTTDETSESYSEPKISEPPPPPPPEIDETDEEREKRTRRLFFGA